MTDIIAELKAVGALCEGHFVLSSGRHAGVFIRKNLLFADPAATARVCTVLAERMRAAYGRIDVVVAPAVGGIIPGYETARALGARAFYVERENGVFALRRGFHFTSGERIAVVEDVVTTGLSLREAMAAVVPAAADAGAQVVGAAGLVDRAEVPVTFGFPFIAAAELRLPSYPADGVPPQLAAIPITVPGSRHL